jgi:TolB-like protein
VLPFANLSGDPAQDYLADGLTDNLVDALAQNPGLFVIARNATQVYRGEAVAPRAGRRISGSAMSWKAACRNRATISG